MGQVNLEEKDLQHSHDHRLTTGGARSPREIIIKQLPPTSKIHQL